MSSTATSSRHDITEMKTRFITTTQNTPKIVAISRPFSNNNSLIAITPFNQSQIATSKRAKFLFVSLNDEKANNAGSATSRGTKESLALKQPATPRKPEGVTSPGRLYYDKKCRVLTVPIRKSVSPKAEPNNQSMETKLRLSQAKVSQLTKALEERDREVLRLRRELALSRRQCVQVAAKVHRDVSKDMSENRSISNINTNSAAFSRRGSASNIQAYSPVTVEKLRKATVALRPTRSERNSLGREVSSRKVAFKGGSVKNMPHDTSRYMVTDTKIGEQLKNVKAKVAKKMEDAYKLIETLKRYLRVKDMPGSKPILCLNDSDLL